MREQYFPRPEQNCDFFPQSSRYLFKGDLS